MTKRSYVAAATSAVALVALSGTAWAQGGPQEVRTPAEIVATYNSLADGILALKRTEEHVVRSILAASSAHAQVEIGRAHRAIAAGDSKAAEAALENVAAAVGQMATEGDAAVGAIRKRLLEGGSHHNASGEAQGIYDDGYVLVKKSDKAKLLESSKAIGQLAMAPKADALDAEWKKVQVILQDLLK